MGTLTYTTNSFSGVVIDPMSLPADVSQFTTSLTHSLGEWRNEGYQVAWLEVPIALASLIPEAVKKNFVFHHSTEEYLMLTCCLETGAFIPRYASHYIGAGGVVLNTQSELLVVSEKHHRSNNELPRFKLPGGALHEGEHLVEGVVREVLEETGVETQFEALVCFRHWHGYRYGKSDIYFVCRLRPLSREITIQEEEIAECQWMPVEDYLGAQTVSSFNKHIVEAALNSPGVVPTEVAGYGDREKYEFFMPHQMAADAG